MTNPDLQPSSPRADLGAPNRPVFFTAAITPELRLRLWEVDPRATEEDWMVRLGALALGESPNIQHGAVFEAEMTPIVGLNSASFSFVCEFVQAPFAFVHLNLRLA